MRSDEKKRQIFSLSTKSGALPLLDDQALSPRSFRSVSFTTALSMWLLHWSMHRTPLPSVVQSGPILELSRRRRFVGCAAGAARFAAVALCVVWRCLGGPVRVSRGPLVPPPDDAAAAAGKIIYNMCVFMPSIDFSGGRIVQRVVPLCGNNRTRAGHSRFAHVDAPLCSTAARRRAVPC